MGRSTGLFDDVLTPAGGSTGLFDDVLAAPVDMRAAQQAANAAQMTHTRPRPRGQAVGVTPEPTLSTFDAAKAFVTPAPGWEEVLTGDVPLAAQATGALAIAGMRLKQQEMVQRELATNFPHALRLKGNEIEDRIARERGVISEAEQDLQGISDRGKDRSLLQRAAPMVSQSLMVSGLGVGAGFATRSPAVALAAIAPPTYGMKYGELRNAGAPIDLADQHALIETGLELGTEALPFHLLFKSDVGGLRRLMSVILAEEGGETAAALTQGVNDHIAALRVAGKPITRQEIMVGLSEAAKLLPETWVSTALASGIQTGAVHYPLKSAAARQLRKEFEAALAEAADLDARLALDPINTAQFEQRNYFNVEEASGGLAFDPSQASGPTVADQMGPVPEGIAGMLIPETATMLEGNYDLGNVTYTSTGAFDDLIPATPADQNAAPPVPPTEEGSSSPVPPVTPPAPDPEVAAPAAAAPAAPRPVKSPFTGKKYSSGDLGELERQWDDLQQQSINEPDPEKRAAIVEQMNRLSDEMDAMIAAKKKSKKAKAPAAAAPLPPAAAPLAPTGNDPVDASGAKGLPSRAWLRTLSDERLEQVISQLAAEEDAARRDKSREWDDDVEWMSDRAIEARRERLRRERVIQIKTQITEREGKRQGAKIKREVEELRAELAEEERLQERVILDTTIDVDGSAVRVRLDDGDIGTGDGYLSIKYSGLPKNLSESGYWDTWITWDEATPPSPAEVQSLAQERLAELVAEQAPPQKAKKAKKAPAPEPEEKWTAVEPGATAKGHDRFLIGKWRSLYERALREGNTDAQGQLEAEVRTRKGHAKGQEEINKVKRSIPNPPPPAPTSLADTTEGRTAPEPVLPTVEVQNPVPTDPVRRTMARRADQLEQALKKKAEKIPGIMPKRDTPLGASTIDTLFKDALTKNDDETDAEFRDRQLRFADRMRNAGLAAQLSFARKHLKTRFHFKDIVIPKDANPREALDVILDLFNNADTLAAVTGLPRGAIGMGVITLNLPKTLGNKYTRGMFSWGQDGNVLSIARRSDSFAHEWFHAIDVWLMQYITGQPSAGIASGRIGMELAPDPILRAHSPELEAALRSLLKDVFYAFPDDAFERLQQLMHEEYALTQEIGTVATQGPKLTAKLAAEARLPVIRDQIKDLLSKHLGEQAQGSLYQDAQSGGQYFSLPWEMLARAMEAYVANVVGQAKGTEIISAPPTLYTDPTSGMRAVYPGELERLRVFASIANFFSVLSEVYQFQGKRAVDRRKTAANSPRLTTLLVLETQKIPELGWVPQAVNSMRRDGQALKRAVTATIRQVKNSAAQPVHTWHSAAAVMRKVNEMTAAPYFYSLLGMLNSMQDKYQDNAAVHALLVELRDKLAFDAGTSEYAPYQYQLRVEQHVAAQNARLARIIKLADLREDNAAQMQQLRSILIRSTEIQLSSAQNVQRKATESLDEARKHLKRLDALLDLQLQQLEEKIDAAFKLATLRQAAREPTDPPEARITREEIAKDFQVDRSRINNEYRQRLDVLIETIDVLERDIRMAKERIETVSAPEAALSRREAIAKEAFSIVDQSATLKEAISELAKLQSRLRQNPADRALADRVRWYTEAVREVEKALNASGQAQKMEAQVNAVREAAQILESEVLRLKNERSRRDALPDLKNLPTPMLEAARAMRELFDEEYYYNIEAGVELGYVPNGYLPRIINDEALETEGERIAFTRAATRVYEDHLRHEKARVNIELSLLRNRLNQELNSAQINKRPADTRELEARMRKLQTERDGLADMNPVTMAEEYVTAARVPQLHEHVRSTPSSNYLKGRVLPASADDLLAPWYLNNPIELTRRYIMASARRAEYARDWGQHDEKLAIMQGRLIAGGIEMSDWDQVDVAIKIATGRYVPYLATSAGQQGAQIISNLGTMALLGLAAFASLPEPMVYGIQTGDVPGGLKAVFQQFAYMVRTDKNRAAGEIAELMGIVSDAITEQSLHNRFFWSEGQSQLLNTLLPRYFTMTLLAPLTRGQRVLMTSLGMKYFLRQSAAFLKGDAGAKADFNEFGIPPEKQKAFAEWMLRTGELTPETYIREQDESYKQILAKSLYRFVDIIIQNPGIETRPMGAFSSYGRMIFSIMGFAMSFQRNVMVRNAKKFQEIGERNSNSTRLERTQAQLVWAAPRLLSAALLASFGLLARMLRDLWGDPTGDRLKRRIERMQEDPALAVLDTLSGAGFTGGFDPIYQSIRYWRFEKDFATTVVGAVPGWYLQHTQNIWDGFVRDPVGDMSPNSNWAERRAWESLILMGQGIAVPMGLTYANVVGPTGFLLMSALNNRGFAKTAAEALAPKTEQELDRERRRKEAAARKKERERYGLD